MALGTVTEVKTGVFGDLRYAIVDVQLTSGANYTAGGEGFDVAQIPGFKSVVYDVTGDIANGYQVQWIPSTKKLMVRQGDNANVAAAPGVEVAGNTNLSAVTARLIAFGK